MKDATSKRERFLDVRGVRLRAIVEGEGEPVLALHGFTGSAESMECIVPALLPDHCVVRLDLIGHGRSDCPASHDAYAMHACADQVLEAARLLELDRPHLLGYSMGGRAAIAAAVADPHAFSSLILVGATAGIVDSSQRHARIAADRALADRIEREGVEAFVDEWMALPIFASQSSLGAVRLEEARRQRLANRAIGLANSLRGMGAGAQEPLFDRLSRFPSPVLLVVGERDAKFREIAATLEGAFPDARTRILSGVGHAAHLEAPVAFGEAVLAFLETIPGARSMPRSMVVEDARSRSGDRP